MIHIMTRTTLGMSLHQNRIALVSKNREENGGHQAISIKIESRENSIILAANHQELFSWRFGHQVK